MIHINKGQYVFVGVANGLCKFVHESNVAEAKETNNTFTNEDYRDVRWQHFVTLDALRDSKILGVTNFFENESAMPYINYGGNVFDREVTEETAREFETKYGVELGLYEYLRANNLQGIASYVPEYEFGYNTVVADIWVPYYVASENNLLPEHASNSAYQLDI